MSVKTLFTVEQKREIVAAYEDAPWGSRAAVLPTGGVTRHQMREWRAARDAGLLEVGATPRLVVTTPRSESAELTRLRQEIIRLEADVVAAHQLADDRQFALDTLGKATALLHALVSGKSATVISPAAPSTRSK